jgi:phosphatidylserine synthase
VLHQEAAVSLSRAGRAGVRLTFAGSTLHVLFAIMVGVTVVVTGKPWEASFVLFALGFLLLVVGEMLLGFGVRRAGALRSAAQPFWVGATAAFVAIAVFTDPWHDIALAVYASTWIALGMILRRGSRSSVVTSNHRVSGERGGSQPFQAIRHPR